MDKIFVENLVVFANHGVKPEETVLGQKFLISMEAELDTRPAGVSDDLDKTTNYSKLSKRATALLKENTFKLIEAAAEFTAEKLLLEFPINSIKFKINKPWAPIGLPLDNVGVEITRSWHTAYLSLGSNIGDSRAYLDKAIKALEIGEKIKVCKVATYIETAPYGKTDQANFINTAVMIKTLFTPQELLHRINAIEAELGRERTEHWGPRTIDIDIVLYDDIMINTDILNIPHIDAHNRTFVLEPLCEIAPYAFFPNFNTTALDLYNRIKK